MFSNTEDRNRFAAKVVMCQLYIMDDIKNGILQKADPDAYMARLNAAGFSTDVVTVAFSEAASIAQRKANATETGAANTEL